MQVITIHEENHGFIGTAATMKAAFRFLIEHHWLTPKSELYDEATGARYTLRSVFEAKNIEPTKENILAWAMEYADDAMFWDGAFYFSTNTVCESEGWESHTWVITEKGCVITCPICGERLELCYLDGTEVRHLPHCPWCGKRIEKDKNEDVTFDKRQPPLGGYYQPRLGVDEKSGKIICNK